MRSWAESAIDSLLAVFLDSSLVLPDLGKPVVSRTLKAWRRRPEREVVCSEEFAPGVEKPRITVDSSTEDSELEYRLR